MTIIVRYNNELTHHGILGQRWGVRRFQNKDGSLTAKGKQHQAENGWNKDSDTHKYSNEEIIKSGNAKMIYKNRMNLSNKEMQEALSRITMETTLKKAISEAESQKSRLYKYTKNMEKVTSVLKTHNEFLDAANNAYEKINKTTKMINEISEASKAKKAKKDKKDKD